MTKTRLLLSRIPLPELKLRLENTRLRKKIVEMRMDVMRSRGAGSTWAVGASTAAISELIRRKNRLRTQEKKLRLELDRRERELLDQAKEFTRRIETSRDRAAEADRAGLLPEWPVVTEIRLRQETKDEDKEK